MKIASWNVNSIRARESHVTTWLAKEQPDLLLIQEIKAMDDTFPEFSEYHATIVGQKSYNGVAILSKEAVEVVNTSLPGRPDNDEQARYLEIDYQGVRIINIYAPNGNPVDSEKYPYKLAWMEALFEHAQELIKNEIPFLIAGDYNIIPKDEDCADPAAWADDALFKVESRAYYRKLIYLGLTDGLRMFERSPGKYTFWNYQAGAWQKNNGIRIDHVLMSAALTDRCLRCWIDKDERAKDTPSDHVPIIAEFASL